MRCYCTSWEKRIIIIIVLIITTIIIWNTVSVLQKMQFEMIKIIYKLGLTSWITEILTFSLFISNWCLCFKNCQISFFKEFFKRSFTLPWRITPSNPDSPVQSVNWKINYLHSTGFGEEGQKVRQLHIKVNVEWNREWKRTNMDFVHRADRA